MNQRSKGQTQPPIERIMRWWFFRPRKCLSCQAPLKDSGAGFCSNECAMAYQDDAAW